MDTRISIDQDFFESEIENLIKEAQVLSLGCDNCGCESIKIYFDYRVNFEDWLESPTHYCADCDTLEYNSINLLKVQA